MKMITSATLSLPIMNYQTLGAIGSQLQNTPKMPMLFVGHGSPMNAIEDNAFSREWKKIGAGLPHPQAILVISAHWVTNGSVAVTAMETPRTIHDFGGFPQELFDQEYPAQGSPQFAKETIELVTKTYIREDFDWGLDHGTWSVLQPMFPKHEIPVFQLSIDYSQPAQFHFELGKELHKLREKGVLIIGSGNIVHNLYELNTGGSPYDWNVSFDNKITEFIDKRDFESVVNFQDLGELAKKAHPTYDHFLPLLYTLGATDSKETISYFNDEFSMGSLSMRSLLIGG